tara:strand:+ start:210 stop:968 length:759 start_codon:yes stop_codon:yes gene_type:complete
MKNLLFLIVLIVGMVMIIASCKKDDDSSTAATTSGCTVVSSCSATASTDNVSGIAGNGYLTGTYDKFVHASASYTIDNSTGCVSDTNLISAYSSAIPTGTASFQYQFVMTSTTTFVERNSWYSDTSCATPIATFVKGFTNFATGDNLSGLSVSGKPSTATQYTATETCTDTYPYNEAGVTFLDSLVTGSGITHVSGTRSTCAGDGDTEYGIMNISDSTWDATVNDNRTLVVESRESSAMTTWDDPDTLTRID